jgi:glycosyltransferase involved in cell wall biosynthesis
MSPASPYVTVIIATYNRRETLQHAIKSVLWQTFSDFECWIVGDACTDDSESVVAGFQDPRLHWYNLPQNSGYQSAPNNEGLRRAQGEYIAYLNHDDIWLPNHLEVLVEAIERNKSDFAFTIMEWVRYDGHFTDFPNYPEAPRPPEASATMHRRDVVDRIGYWKAPHETQAFPRVAFFRTAQFAGMSFEIVPRLTVIKFDSSKAGSTDGSQQRDYIERISQDPSFSEKEVAVMLMEAYWRLEGPLTWKGLRFQLLQSLRTILIKRHIEPDTLMPWIKPGQRIERWRRDQGFDSK